MDLREIAGFTPTRTMPLIGENGATLSLSDTELSQMGHSQLFMLRKQNPSKEAQNLLAAYEHRAAAREAGSQNPLLGASYAAAAPLYQLAKMAGTQKSRSDPSLRQIGQGMYGAYEGIKQYITGPQK